VAAEDSAEEEEGLSQPSSASMLAKARRGLAKGENELKNGLISWAASESAQGEEEESGVRRMKAGINASISINICLVTSSIMMHRSWLSGLAMC